MKKYLNLLLFLYPACVFGQIIVEGTVQDRQNAPIAFASIRYADGKGGTLSNELGQFVLTVPALPAELEVSHVSFLRSIYTVHDPVPKITIFLYPVVHYLTEVTVDGNEAVSIIKQAYDRAVEDKQVFQYGKAFYRQTSFIDSSPIEVLEAFYDTRFNNNGIDTWRITQGRFAKRSIKGSLDFLNFSMYTSLCGVYQEASKKILLPLSRDGLNEYDFEITDTYSAKDGDLVAITCKPQPTLAKPAFEGLLFIDPNSNRIMKMIGKVTLGSQGVELTFNHKPLPYQNLVLTTEIVYQKTLASQLDLSYIKMGLEVTYTMEGITHTASVRSLCTLCAYDTSLSKSRFKKVSKNTNDLKTIKGAGYNAAFWKDNPIVKRTPLEQGIIESFEAEGAFGNYLPGHQD